MIVLHKTDVKAGNTICILNVCIVNTICILNVCIVNTICILNVCIVYFSIGQQYSFS